MKILAYESFRTCYQQLPLSIQRKVDKQLQFLADNPRYPSLHTKRIRGTTNIWEARLDLHYRMTFEMSSDTIVLRIVGHHDEALKNP